MNTIPNIVPIGIYLQNDEFSIDEETLQKVFSPVHIHFDYVYVAHLGKSLKTGMELQCSMSGALAEMGFVTAKGKGTAQQQFEEAVRHDLQDFAEARGIKIDRPPGEKHSHKEKPVYQQMKENEKKEKSLSKKELELAEREKVVELGEAPLLEKQKELDEQENEIDQKSKNAEQALQDAQTIQAENEKASKNLELEQNDLERDKSLFRTSAQKVGAYNQIWDEVERKNMSIDSEVSTFNSNRFEDISSRFNKFVGNVKKIVTAITTELNWYKAAFKNFWHKTPRDFRNLADEMDRNKCEDFSDYNKKFYNGELDYQIHEKNQIQQQHIIRQKKINDAYEWNR